MNIKILATEVDKLGNTIEIMQCDTLGHSPVYSFFLRHMSALIDNGHCFPITTWDDDRCGAVYAQANGKVLGHIVYDTDNPNAPGALWITLSAVDESCRGRGIYTILHKYFEQVAKERGCWSIASHVHVKNTVRLKSAESVGMKPVFYVIGKKIQ